VNKNEELNVVIEAESLYQSEQWCRLCSLLDCVM